MATESMRCVSGVSVDRLMASAESIAQRERVAGTPDELESFLWLREQMLRLGAETVLHNRNAYMAVAEDASLHAGGEDFPCEAHAMAPSTGDVGVSGGLSYGGKVTELTVDNCSGQIVLVDGRAERDPIINPIIRAQGLGAIGVICISSDSISESRLSPAWCSPSHLNRHLLPSIPVVSVTAAAGTELKRLIARGRATATLRTEADAGWLKIPLLVAEFKALVPTNEFVMFSGYVDSLCFGSMDNGSGNATMIEVGRIAAARKQELRRNLRLVFFSARSQGRCAESSWYSDHFWEDIHANCMISVSIGSVGGTGAGDQTRWTVVPEARWVAAETIKEHSGAGSVGRQCSNTSDRSFWGAGVSCAFAFSKQQAGGRPRSGKFAIPAEGSRDLGWWWRTPEDNVDRIDLQNASLDARIFPTFVASVLTRRVSPLDFRASAAEILGVLQDWQEQAGIDFCLAEPIARAERLVEALQRLYVRMPDEGAPDAAVHAFNRAVWDIGRILVPLNYTCGNAFENDPAVARPPTPALSSIGKLTNRAGDDVRKEVQVDLVRRRNYVQHSLNRALEVLGA